MRLIILFDLLVTVALFAPMRAADPDYPNLIINRN